MSDMDFYTQLLAYFAVKQTFCTNKEKKPQVKIQMVFYAFSPYAF